MLRNLFLTALTSFVLLSNGFAGASPRDDREKEVKIKTSAICGMCKARIERNLAFEKGVKESTLDVKSKVVTIKYNPAKTDVAKLKANISKTGYDAERGDGRRGRLCQTAKLLQENGRWYHESSVTTLVVYNATARQSS